jgi:flagellar biosynthesis/type III secretory pathway M-ring protein FliF/YscJ
VKEAGVDEDKAGRSGTGRQLLGSLAAAALIVALAIWAVTAKLGPTSIAEQEAAEERAEEGEEAAEEKAEEAEEKAEEAGEAGDSGRGRGRRGRDR